MGPGTKNRPDAVAKSKPDGRDPFRRYRLSIPLDDKEVIDWLEAQSNPSFSVRTVIKAAIKDSGVRDVTCGIQDVRVLLGLARIAEAYQVGIGAIPASTLVDDEIRTSRERLAASGTPGQDVPPAPDHARAGPADPPGGRRTEETSAPPRAQAPSAPARPAYPTPAPGGRTEQVFMDPENMLNNM